MKFSDIPAHQSAKERLRAMIDADRMPHALLISGPAGIGKFMLARAAAQYIHCENRTPDGDSCGRCPSCLQHQSFNHIDTIFIYPIVKGRGDHPISEDYLPEWRKFLQDSPFMDFRRWMKELNSPNTQPSIYVDDAADIVHKLSFTSHKARYKVVLVWLPERMQPNTANKLLKIIEEPHADTIFILVSNNPGEILPTIYSRTQRLELKRLADADVAAYLEQHSHIPTAEALSVAHTAEGSIIEAESALSLTDEKRKFLELFIRLMRLAYQRSVGELRQWATDVASAGREEQIRFLTFCQRLIRENLIYNIGDSSLNYMSSEEAAFSSKFARFINERNVLKISAEIDQATIDIAGTGNSKMVLFDLAVRMIVYIKA